MGKYKVEITGIDTNKLKVLKNNETIELFKKYRIEPKRIRFVYPKEGKECNTFLIEGAFLGKTGLKIEPPLYTHNEDGSYSDEVKQLVGEMNVK